jgi:hypothetical protein
VHFLSYHFDFAVILSGSFFVMDTGCVLCEVSTDFFVCIQLFGRVSYLKYLEHLVLEMKLGMWTN